MNSARVKWASCLVAAVAAMFAAEGLCLERALVEGRSVACSPDGKRLAFERDVGFHRRIGIFERATGKVTWPDLGTGTACHPSFGPKGELYYAYNGNTNTSFEIQKSRPKDKDWLNIYRWNGGRPERITSGMQFDMTPSVSPDGKTLYFASTRPVKGKKETNFIYSLDLTKPDAKPVMVVNGSINYCSGVTDPVVSPDGKTLAWAEYSGWTPPYLVLSAPIADLPVVEPQKLKPLTDNLHEFAFAPRFDPSGRYMCFSSTFNNERWGVFLVDLETGVRRRVADGKEAAFSPDGSLFYERGDTIYELDWRKALAFEKIALVDQFDFTLACDVEKKSGCEFMLDHTRLMGVSAVAWRQQTGGRPRYRSESDSHPLAESGVSRLRIPENRHGYAWLNLERGEVDLLKYQLNITADGGLVPAVHFTLEESHYFSSTFSSWVLEHPEYWCIMASGLPWPGHSSFSYPEAVEHKIGLLEEVISRGARLVYLGLDRLCGYGPRFEYTKPSVDRWRRIHGTEPPTNYKDPAWIKHCGLYLEDAVRALARTCRKRGVRVILGTRTVGIDTDMLRDDNGFDWRRICADGEVDGVCIEYVNPDDPAVKGLDAWEAIDRIYAKCAKECGSRTDLYFTCNMYGGPSGVPALAKKTGLSKGECAKRLLQLAKKHGGKGVTLHIVDYCNYPADVCKALRECE